MVSEPWFIKNPKMIICSLQKIFSLNPLLINLKNGIIIVNIVLFFNRYPSSDLNSVSKIVLYLGHKPSYIPTNQVLSALEIYAHSYLWSSPFMPIVITMPYGIIRWKNKIENRGNFFWITFWTSIIFVSRKKHLQQNLHDLINKI